MSKLYLRFLRITRALEANKKDMKDVDSTANLLLNEIAIQHLDEKPLTVSQAMKLDAIASPATLHRKIDELREAGLIDLTFEGKNRRTKYLIPTKAAHSYFEKMSDSMLKAIEY
jgi:DNA-binding MarR family transcriptional regulator